MSYLTAQKLNRIFHFERTVRGGDHSGITFLSAHGSIERCLLYNNSTHFTVRQCLHQFRFRGKHRHFRVICQMVVPYKLRGD